MAPSCMNDIIYQRFILWPFSPCHCLLLRFKHWFKQVVRLINRKEGTNIANGVYLGPLCKVCPWKLLDVFVFMQTALNISH